MRNRIHRPSLGGLFAKAALAAVLVAATTIGTADARVDPLLIISRQIHPPNVLVVLDTSGSLTGVPGGTFATSTEVGVDCDDGVNCRGGVAQGTCNKAAKACYSDAQCQSATCKLDGAACLLNSDCAPQQGTCNQKTCNQWGTNCVYAACFADATKRSRSSSEKGWRQSQWTRSP